MDDPVLSTYCYHSFINKKELCEISLVAQWLRLCASTTEGVDSTLGWGIKILHVVHCGQKKKKKKSYVKYVA